MHFTMSSLNRCPRALSPRGLKGQRGVTSIEYALLGALIAVVIVGTVQSVGLSLFDLYEFVSDKVGDAVSGGAN